MKKDYTTSFRISEELKKRLEAYAEEQDVPVAQVIRKAIEQYLKSKESVSEWKNSESLKDS